MKTFFSGLAIALTFIAFYPYIRATLTGTTRPHVFSWVIWSLTTLIVFFATLADHGGVGAWPTGVSAVVTMFIAWLAFRMRGDVSVKRLDWFFFILALLSLPLWQLAADPMWAVILLTTIDLLGFAPTLRKCYDDPYSESVSFYALFALRTCFLLFALEHYSVTTVLFPTAIGFACLLLIAIVYSRRRTVSLP